MAKYTEFEHYLRTFYNGDDPTNRYLVKLLGLSKIHLGRVLAKPQIAKVSILLRIANLLEVTTYHLIKEWSVAANNLSTDEIDFYKEHDDNRKERKKNKAA